MFTTSRSSLPKHQSTKTPVFIQSRMAPIPENNYVRLSKFTVKLKERERWGGREGERQTDRHRERQRDRQTERQTDRETEGDRQTDRGGVSVNIHTGTNSYTKLLFFSKHPSQT